MFLTGVVSNPRIYVIDAALVNRILIPELQQLSVEAVGTMTKISILGLGAMGARMAASLMKDRMIKLNRLSL